MVLCHLYQQVFLGSPVLELDAIDCFLASVSCEGTLENRLSTMSCTDNQHGEKVLLLVELK